MKTKFLLFGLFAACSLVSCVNTDYDLSKLDTTVTLIPGMTIPVDQVSNYTSSDIFGITASADASNNGVYCEHKYGTTVPVTPGTPAQVASFNTSNISEVMNGNTGNIQFKGAAISLTFKNTTGKTGTISVDITSGTEKVHRDGISVSSASGNQTLTIKGDDIDQLLSKSLIVGNVVVNNLIFNTSETTKISNVIIDGAVTVGASLSLPYSFKKGSTLQNTYELTPADLGINTSDYEFDATELNVECSVSNPIPARINLSFTTDVEGVKGALSKAVEPGTRETPATTDVTVSITGSNSFTQIKKIYLTVSAEAIDDVEIADNMNFMVKVNSMSLPSGITIGNK